MSVINVCCPGNLDLCDSYGLLSAQVVRHVARLGHYVNVSCLRDSDYGSLPPDIANAATRPFRAPDGTIFIGYPTKYELHGPEAQVGARVAITMFESSRIPATWVPILNQLDAVIVPSTFLVDAFRQSGVTVPVHVVPLGVGEVYQYAERPSGRPLTFLTFIDRGRRKGGMAALQAFLMAFGSDTNYRLLIKGRNPKVKLNFINPNVEAIQQDMSDEELYRLYVRCDVLINPNKGEGFGLIPREFAATGGIALTTDWGGTADHLHEWGWPLPYTLEKASWPNTRFEGQELGEWAACDAGEVAQVLRHVAANIDDYRAAARQKAKRAARYTWQRFVLDVLYIWKGKLDGKRTGLHALAA